MSHHPLTHWRGHVHRVGRDLGVPRAARMPLAAALVAGGGFLAYRRYKSVKIGDQVSVNIAGLGLPIPPGSPTTATGKVAALNSDGSYAVQFIVGGVLAPSGTTVPATAILENLTPRLF